MATGTEVIRRVRRLISDEVALAVGGVRWSDEELLVWISEAQREIVSLKPEANVHTEVCAVTGGETRQWITSENTPGRVEDQPLVPARLIRVETNTDDTPPDPAPPVTQGIHTGLIEASDQWFIGFCLSNTLVEGTPRGSVIGDPLPGFVIRVAGEAFVSEVFNGIFSVDGFCLFMRTAASGVPAANAFATVTINGRTFATADCTPTSPLTTFTGDQSDRPDPPYVPETAVRDGNRVWFWPTETLALEDDTDYALTFT